MTLCALLTLQGLCRVPCGPAVRVGGCRISQRRLRTPPLRAQSARAQWPEQHPCLAGLWRQLRTHRPGGGLDTPEWTKQYKPQRKSKSVPGGEGTQTVIPEGTWLHDKGKQLQTTTASHLHLKLILWPAVQVISNVKLYKNIIPNHNRGKPFSFHIHLLHSAVNTYYTMAVTITETTNHFTSCFPGREVYLGLWYLCKFPM